MGSERSQFVSRCRAIARIGLGIGLLLSTEAALAGNNHLPPRVVRPAGNHNPVGPGPQGPAWPLLQQRPPQGRPGMQGPVVQQGPRSGLPGPRIGGNPGPVMGNRGPIPGFPGNRGPVTGPPRVVVNSGPRVFNPAFRGPVRPPVINQTFLVNQFRTVQVRTPVFHSFYRRDYFDRYYSGYVHYGFFGAYWYGMHPCYDIYRYYRYPVLYWLYFPQPEVNFFINIFGPYYQQYPVEPFPYAQAFLPTEPLRDLGIEVSQLPPVSQYNFRHSLVAFAATARDQISWSLHAPFNFKPYSIAINHYTPLSSPDGQQVVVIEGAIEVPPLPGQAPCRFFKALLDLNDWRKTITFVASGPVPFPGELLALDAINRRMRFFGFDPMTPPNAPAFFQEPGPEAPPQMMPPYDGQERPYDPQQEGQPPYYDPQQAQPGYPPPQQPYPGVPPYDRDGYPN